MPGTVTLCWMNAVSSNSPPSQAAQLPLLGETGKLSAWTITGQPCSEYSCQPVPYSVYNGTLINNHIHAVAFDAAGNVWIGYVNQGVSQFHSEEGRWIHHKQGQGTIGGDEMRAILVRPAGSGTTKSDPE